MQIEIVLLAVFSILFVLSMFVYNFGDKISFKKKDKKSKPEKKESPKVVKTEGDKAEKKEEPHKIKPVSKKTERPVLLSPAPMEQKKLEAPKQENIRHRVIDETEINEIRKFIESKPEQTMARQGLSDYNKIETFGDVIDIDDSYPSFVGEYNPYVNRPQKSEESDFLKNRGEDKKLYEELKNMSPEMKKIIMADILRRKH